MTKKPSYRFVGYTEPWVEKKLGEVVDVNSGKDYKHLSKGEIPVYGTGGYMLSVSESLSDADGIGIGRKGTIDKPYILKAPFWTVDTLFYCIPRDAYNLYFVYSIFNNVTWKKFDESTGVPSLSKITINNIQSSFPSLPEQTAIGSFFQDIDQLISFQQRKLEVLKEQKKTYLKLLFPAKGQTKPALRFAGFEDEWKEVKLGEIIQSISSKNYITEYYEEGNNPVIQQGDIPIVGFSDNKPFNNFSNVILFGDHTLSLFKPETPFLLATDGIKILHSDLTTQPFLFIMLERYLPKSQGYKRHYSLLKNELSSLPSLPEQEVIGSFFQDLDKAIAKQEEKVNQLKASKQTLLRKMFI